MDQEKPSKRNPALIGGIFFGVTSALNLGCFNFLILGGGLLASFLYLRKYSPELPSVTYGDGAVLGLLTGLIGTAVWVVVEIPINLLILVRGESLEDLVTDPQILEFLQSLPFGTEAALLIFGTIFGVFPKLIISSILNPLGGIIGIALFRKKEKPVPAVEQPYEPPPRS